jgi:hypothetical protein
MFLYFLVSTPDLIRARCDVADAVFLLADRFCDDRSRQDSLTILRALNVKSFRPDIRVYVQILQPENKAHIFAAGVAPENVLCVDEIKLTLMGQSVNFCGLSTLITNMVISTSQGRSEVLPKWQNEYFHGLSQEIYTVELLHSFANSVFTKVVHEIYTKSGSLLFGILSHEGEIILNPGGRYLLRKGDLGIMLCDDQSQADEFDEIFSTTKENSKFVRVMHELQDVMKALKKKMGSVVAPDTRDSKK